MAQTVQRSGVLSSKYFLYATEFFCRDVSHGDRAGCQPTPSALFQFVTDRLDHHHWYDHDRYGYRQCLGRTAG